MPHLARSILQNTKHRHHQLRPTPRNRLQHPNIPGNKLRLIQRHLPALPSRHPRLLANIRHHSGKIVHLPTAFTSVFCCSCSQCANFSTSHSSPRNSAAIPSRSHRTPHLVTRSGAIVSRAKTQSRTQQGLWATPRVNLELNFTGKTRWICLRGRYVFREISSKKLR
jgi:hypothetical protein